MGIDRLVDVSFFVSFDVLLSWASCCDGHSLVKSPFLCLFEVQRDNGFTFTKLDQVSPGANRFGHLNVNDFHHLVTNRHVLNVQRFKVEGASFLPLVLDFSKQIGHAIAHNTAACHVRVHVQCSRGVSHHRTKRYIQVGETPIHAETQPNPHGPCTIRGDLVIHRVAFRIFEFNVTVVGYPSVNEFHVQVAPKDPLAIRVFFKPPHFFGHDMMNGKVGDHHRVARSKHVLVPSDVAIVQHQLLSFPDKCRTRLLSTLRRWRSAMVGAPWKSW